MAQNFKFAHSCIRVLDLEESMKFYQEALGFREARRKDFPDDGFTLVYLEDENGNFELELTYNYDREEPYTIGDGYSHLAVAVDDLEAAHERHKEMGYEVTDLMGLSGSEASFYFLTDPDGYDIEVIRA